MINLGKYILLVSAYFISTYAYSAVTPNHEIRNAIEISIGSIGTEIDQNAVRQFRKAIGSAVTRNIVDKFMIYGYGIEGGFSGCVETSPNVFPAKAFARLIKELRDIHPKAGTVVSIKRVRDCADLSAANKPVTVQVAKSDGSMSCDADNGISLADMQKTLGAIAVFSAQKLSDGLMRPAVCGMTTGLFNVFEIAEDDLDQALASGFNPWSEIVGSLDNPLVQSPQAKVAAAIVRYQCMVVG